MGFISRVAYNEYSFDPALTPSTTADARLITDHDEVPISQVEPGSRVLSTDGKFYELLEVQSLVVKWDHTYRPIHLAPRALGNRRSLWLSPACLGAVDSLKMQDYSNDHDTMEQEKALGERVVTEGQGAVWITYYRPLFSQDVTAVVDGLPIAFAFH